MNHSQKLLTIVACLILAAIALFPPRRPASHANTADFRPSRKLVFSPGIGTATRPLRSGNGEIVRDDDGDAVTSTEPVTIDGGRLLAEFMLVLAGFGLAVVSSMHRPPS